MGHWNYRVCRESNEQSETGELFAVREVYYRDDGTVRAWSRDYFVDASGETLAELVEVLDKVREAERSHPVLDLDQEQQ